ncbi:hypothetical protein OF83DRAFT_1173160 [Amylostereum chailletii]|nr:hypothetical protein OF83DRAFT_1173160 [Amylostereum chailletii]
MARGLLQRFEASRSDNLERPSTPPHGQPASATQPGDTSTTNTLFMASPSPRPARHPREEDNDNESSDCVTPRTAKRTKLFAWETCERLNMPVETLDHVAGLTDRFLMVAVLGAVEAHEMKVKKTKLQEKFGSQDFEDVLGDRLCDGLMAAHLTAYVTQASDNFINVLKCFPSAFEVPREMLYDTSIASDLLSMVKEMLTDERANIKQKLGFSMGLGGRKVLNTRVAFLRLCLQEFEAMLAEPTSAPDHGTGDDDDDGEPQQSQPPNEDNGVTSFKPRDFWKFVDEELFIIRQRRANASTTEEGTALYNELFSHILQEDLKTWQSENPMNRATTVPMREVHNEWQRVLEKHLQWHNVHVVAHSA